MTDAERKTFCAEQPAGFGGIAGSSERGDPRAQPEPAGRGVSSCIDQTVRLARSLQAAVVFLDANIEIPPRAATLVLLADIETELRGTMPGAFREDQEQLDREPVLIDLALQGGGSHGAFTWGVLDRLLEEPWLRIDGISGTSAGAMNAVVLADGHATGGPKGAKTALDAFWRQVAHAARFSPLRRSPMDIVLGRWTLDTSPFYVAFDLASRVFSPYDLNPGGANPLRDILAECVNFHHVAEAPIRLFVTATNVRTGRGRVFRNAELTPDVLLASACLPTMFQAIEIDGEAYWDGGYSGNPTITPLVRECKSQDTLLVAVNPVERPGIPRSASEIINRLNEVSFNATLLKELRMIALLRQVADAGHSEGAQWARMRIHLIASALLRDLGASSKLNAEWDFLCMLRDEGRRSAEAFLTANGKNVGKRSSIDLDILLQQV